MVEPVYEMLWDCNYCGHKELFGLTHRHCPNCGAKQDPNARYFPADHQKIAVHSHEYAGVDLVCRYCQAACSRRAHNCGQCGAPLTEGAAVQQVAEPVTQTFAPAPASQPPRRAIWKIVLPIAALALVATVVLLLVWKREEKFVVEAHTWKRTVTVERLGPQRQSAWCDQLPSGASDISRHRERRGSKQIPDGEDCRTKRKDRGDGTFVESQECSPKYRDEPVYADKCDFVLVKWATLRQESAEGKSSADAPRWPSVALTRGGCTSAGCEREGTRDETYTVVFRDAKGEQYRCNFDQSAWSAFADGKRYSGKLRALVGSLDCSSLSSTR
jgi:hypothetical protein